MTALAIIPTSDFRSDGRLSVLETRVRSFIGQSKSENTIRAYSADWADFEAWCREHGMTSLPADSKTVELYLADLGSERGMKTSTIKRRIYSIGHFHVVNGYPSPREYPSVKAVLSGIRRHNGTAQQGRDPILKDDLRAMVEALPKNLAGIRDKALLLIGFFSACRRSELIGLDVDDLEFTPQGLVLHLRRSKTDQESVGREVGVPFASDSEVCPVLAVRHLLEALGITTGPIFRAIDRYGVARNGRLTGRSVALIVKRAAEAAGIDSTRLSAHSLRCGFCTEAALQGVEERVIMKQTGHKCERVVRGYIRESSVFQNNGAAQVSF